MSAPGTAVAIRVDHLTQRYGKFEALKDVSLEVRRGEIFGLLGPNGAGKTTMIKVLTGLIAPSAGAARVAGYDVVRSELDVKARVGWVAAEVILDDDLSANENLYIQAKLQNLSSDWKERATLLLGYFGLTEWARTKVGKFSTGMRKKLEIALALLHQPTVIFMDEPTIGLDAGTRRMLWDFIQSVHREYGVTVLLTTHYIEEADILCDRVAIIDSGKIIAVGTPSDLKSGLGLDLIEIETSVPLDPALFAGLPGVKDLEAKGRQLTVKVATAAATLPLLLAKIPPQQLTRVNVERPNLETVFLQLTGRRMQGTEAPLDMRRFYLQMRRQRG